MIWYKSILMIGSKNFLTILLYMHIIVLWSCLTPSTLLSHSPPPGVVAVLRRSHHSFCALYLSIQILCMPGSKWCLSSFFPLPSSLSPLFPLTLLPPQNANQNFHGFVHLFSKPCSIRVDESLTFLKLCWDSGNSALLDWFCDKYWHSWIQRGKTFRPRAPVGVTHGVVWGRHTPVIWELLSFSLPGWLCLTSVRFYHQEPSFWVTHGEISLPIVGHIYMSSVVPLRTVGLSGEDAYSRLSHLQLRYQRQEQVLREASTTVKNELGLLVAHARNSSTWNTEAGGFLRVWGSAGLHSKFQGSLTTEWDLTS